MPYDTVVAKTIEYLAVPSVVGHEKHFIKFLKNDFENLGVTVIEHEGVLEVHGRTPNTQIISAHIDRHGLISYSNGEFGYAAEYMKECKYNEEKTPTQQMLEAIGDRFNGEEVFAYDPKTGDRIGEGVISDAGPYLLHDDCVFKVHGLPPDLPKNIPVAYARTAISDGKILKGQIDNVVSLGQSWVHITNWLDKKKIETTNLVIIDTSPYREAAPIESGMVVLRNRDKNAKFDKDLTAKIKQRCTDKLIPFQFKDEYLGQLGVETSGLGSTELGRIVEKSQGRWSGASVQIPTTEYHTSYETTSRESIENYYFILQNILVNEPIT